MSGGYAWIVSHSKEQELDAYDPYLAPLREMPKGESRNGVTGPLDAPETLLELLRAGKGREWRTLYDEDFHGHAEDNRVCHMGRYLDWLDVDPAVMPDFRGAGIPHVDEDAELGPLRDLSYPDCRAYMIQFKDDCGTWETVGLSLSYLPRSHDGREPVPTTYGCAAPFGAMLDETTSPVASLAGWWQRQGNQLIPVEAAYATPTPGFGDPY